MSSLLERLSERINAAATASAPPSHEDSGAELAGRAGEEEVIAHPSDAELVEYRFLNHNDFLASIGVLNFNLLFGREIEDRHGVEWGGHTLTNRDAWFDVYRTLVSKKTIDEKQEIGY